MLTQNLGGQTKSIMVFSEVAYTSTQGIVLVFANKSSFMEEMHIFAVRDVEEREK